MEVHFDATLEAKIARLAAEQGRDGQSIVVEAVEQMLDYNQWLIREVEKGIAAADRGELIEHEDVRKLIDNRYSS